MAATAELTKPDPLLEQELLAIEQQILWQAVPETPEDIIVRAEAAIFIGNVLGGRTASVDYVPETAQTKPILSLHDALQRAHETSDEQATKLVECNVLTDRIERTYKSGHIGRKVELIDDELGRSQQLGQSMEAVHANSLLMASAKMRPRTEAETRNKFRIQNYKQGGVMEDYYVLVASPAADNMAAEELDDEGMFSRTMSCSFQLNSLEDGKLMIEPAFVAGKRRPTETRHDLPTLCTLAARHGINLAGKSAAEIIDTPWLIHKSQLPNGVIDIIKEYDEIAGTFFGEASDKPYHDLQAYIDRRSLSHQREEDMKASSQQITQQLIAQTPSIRTDMQACELLAKLNGEDLAYEATTNYDIDPSVLGADAAWRVELSRWHREHGNDEQAEAVAQEAVRVQKSRSCPGGAKGGDPAEQSGKEESKTTKLKDCEFTSKECPKCHARPAKTRVKNGVFYHVGHPCRS